LSHTKDSPDVIRPVLYDEEYWRDYYEDFVTFYDEDFLVSSHRVDLSFVVERDFEDAAVSFESNDPIAYDFATVEQYDPFELRAPNVDGSWRGNYYVNGINPERSGFIERDLSVTNLLQLSEGQEPTYDRSPIDLPNIDFPDHPHEASLKNFVVSYAYFVTDFSAADDPVFDPDKQQCWRSGTLGCDTLPSCGSTGNSATCEPDQPFKTNTAYRLHDYGSANTPILIK
jgi:hypothetical protein